MSSQSFMWGVTLLCKMNYFDAVGALIMPEAVKLFQKHVFIILSVHG
jgi:hypothetical protein